MSITLRDAQHLCWKSFRKTSDLLNRERGQVRTPLVATKDLLVKAGEIATVMKNLEASSPLEGSKMKDTLATRLSDLLYLVFVLAAHYSIELEESFMQTLNDYMLKFIE